MRLLVEPSDYIFRNAGDMAMMHVAISRLVTLWPRASIEVFTADPNMLAVFCPGAIPIVAPRPGIPLAEGSPSESFTRPLLSALKSLVFRSEGVRTALLPVIKCMRLVQAQRTLSGQELPRIVVNAISRADALVVTGMGGVTDAFPEYARGLLERIELALGYGKPVVMLGQGIGPLKDTRLRSKAGAVLPRVPFIALREAKSGIPLLRSLGAHPERIIVTGDDAIEMAISARATSVGRGFGVNLRAATYAEIDSGFVAQCRDILQHAGRVFGAFMVPVPISTVAGEEDIVTIRQIMAGYYKTTSDDTIVDTPLKVIDRITSCRILFAGSYHAAVFSLSLGVPVVCLAKSDYYRDKFLGLAELFGQGCTVILARGQGWQPKLLDALEIAWCTADEVKPHLLAAAERQLTLSRAAYQRMYEFVTTNVSRSCQEI